MKFILHSLNYSPELTGIGKYNGEICPELINSGINVTAIVAPPYYPEWQVKKGFSSITYAREYIDCVKVIRCPLYVPKQVTTLKRIVHLTSFAVSSSIALLSQMFKKPDVIMLVQPTLFCAPSALLFAKLTGAKAVMHIQDYEVDALFGLGMMGDGIFARLAKKCERFLMRRFDAISTISYSMIENAKAKGVDPGNIIHFPNWSDIDFVTPQTSGDALKVEWGFSYYDKIILYAGNMGNKQGLEIVLDAAKHFGTQHNIKFVMVGAGAYVDTLKAKAASLALDNVFFKPLHEWARVPEMLALADIHIVVQKKGAADAVLPSKLTNILSAGGHAIVTAEQHTELGQIALKYPTIYDCVEPENTTAFIDGLTKMLSRDLSSHNTVARQFAEQFLDKKQIIDQFIVDISQLVQRDKH
ncbi:WcaI family glycosyltransferase [Shewanella vesiculosa]|uniref:WcaI family glycosyltransferase n=1 Tax=Shewanella vesiculosa TaxID=518738 RepID=UPI003D021C62